MTAASAAQPDLFEFVAAPEAFRSTEAAMKGGLEDFARAAATPEKTDEAALLTQEDGHGGPTRRGDASVIGGPLAVDERGGGQRDRLPRTDEG